MRGTREAAMSPDTYLCRLELQAELVIHQALKPPVIITLKRLAAFRLHRLNFFLVCESALDRDMTSV
jgi:hypothetical protein